MNTLQKSLIHEIGWRIPSLQNATQDVDLAAARALGVNLTDLRCLGILMHQDKVAASELANLLRLTRGAVTALLDRLVKARLAKRNDDPNDRRGVLISITPYARKRIREVWGPIQSEGEKMLSSYPPESLKLIREFLERSLRLQLKHSERIEKLAKRG
jgi:DNA-binding MarR family transcriptional regulator